MGVLVVVAPGQGAQTPGFLRPWLELRSFASRFGWLSAVADIDLVHYGTEADAEAIRDTAIAQPLLVASAMVAVLEVIPQPADAFRMVGAATGHSVGEIAAAAGVGVLTAEQAMVLVRERGRAMAVAAEQPSTSMTAVLGGDRDEVLARIAQHGLTAANDNGPGQVVAAGTVEQLDKFHADPPARAKLVSLSVAGAFHTEHMEPAVAVLGNHARAISTHDPRTRFISNADGRVVHDGRDVLRRLVNQVSAPVRWDLCMQTMSDLHVTGILEMPPAGTLTGIAKRALKGVETFALKTPDQIEAARAFCEKHAETADDHQSPMDASPTWRMLVSPIKGTVICGEHRLNAGDEVNPGSVVATVKSLRDALPIAAPHGGIVVEWLVEEGDPVSPGQPLLRLHPTAGG